MKCENCGNEEVNFHFSSNVNGNITEKHLCADCATELGFTEKMTEKPEMSFEDIFMELFGVRPSRRMLSGYGLMFPTIVIPTVGILMPKPGAEETAQRGNQPDISIEIDEAMKKRREINMLREQMQQAAATEDYEKAAALRDSIKKLENGE